MAREKARLAELQVEAQFLKKQQLLEQESKLFKLNLEMAKSKAKLDAYKKIKDEDEAIPVLDQVDKSQFVADYVNSYQVPADKSIKDQKISQLKVDVNSK